MARFLPILLLLVCVPLAAQHDSVEREDPIDRWNHLDVGGMPEGQYLPLTLGRDRTGFGLRARGSTGWNDNIFMVDRNEDNAVFIDGVMDIYAGMNAGMFAFGVRGQAAGRLYFGEPEASLWDLKAGAFFKVPYDGGFGFGVSADALFQQLQAYEIAGPITRRDALRAYGVIGRGHVGVGFGEALIAELGLRGQTTDFTEEAELRSLDNWQLGIDAVLYIHLMDIAQFKPYAVFDYQWFRDQVELRPDGSNRSSREKLSLLKFDWGIDGMLDFGFLRASGNIYGRRQDDAAAGFHRYWEYGMRATVDLMLINDWRLSVGGNAWNRNYDERLANPGDEDDNSKVEERYLRAFAELSWNFWEFMHVGGRYTYTRRISNISNGGYAINEGIIFLELIF